MSDPSQLSSTIAELLAKTAGLSSNGGAFNGTVGASTPSTGAFTFVSQTPATGLTAAGTTRTDALALSAAINNLTTVASGTGAVLPAISAVGVGGSVVIFNNGANAAQIYAPGSATIDGTAGSTGVVLTNAKRCLYIAISSTAWLSAQLGVASA